MRRREGGAGPAPAGVVRSCTPGRTPEEPRQLLRAGPGPGTVERESGKSRWRAGQARIFLPRLLWRATSPRLGERKRDGQPQARPNLGPMNLACLTDESVFLRSPPRRRGPREKLAGSKTGSPPSRGRTVEMSENRIRNRGLGDTATRSGFQSPRLLLVRGHALAGL